MASRGHNSVDRKALKAYIDRIENLEAERKSLGEDIKEVYAEAKGTGFDTKIMRAVIRLRKMDKADRQEFETQMNIYCAALGMDLV